MQYYPSCTSAVQVCHVRGPKAATFSDAITPKDHHSLTGTSFIFHDIYPSYHRLCTYFLIFHCELIRTMTSLLQHRYRSSIVKDSDSDLDSDSMAAAPSSTDVNGRGVHFMDFPTEIHILISKNLTYPDALSLKHTSRYFYNLVDTGVRLKVAWLMERRLLHLDCPNDRGCILKTDLEFCRGSVTSVSMLTFLLQTLSHCLCFSL